MTNKYQISMSKKSNKEIRKKMDEIIKNTFTYLCLTDLNFLYRGGRIGRAKSLLGSVLKIIPVVGLFGDEVDSGILPVGKGRTFSAANKVLIDNIKQKMQKYNDKKIKLITILDAEENKSLSLKNLKEQIEDELQYEKIIIGHLRFVEAIHLGPDAWVTTFILK
ncbi:MAG: DegV family protein [Candidatus Cloacimonetes bacterium]|nr:DegV family protein [Candidatus Cloacimonadota bacterium]